MDHYICIGSFVIVVLANLAIIRLARSIPGPTFPSLQEFSFHWRKDKWMALLYLAACLMRTGVWGLLVPLNVGGAAVISHSCGIFEWVEIYTWVIRPTLDFLGHVMGLQHG